MKSKEPKEYLLHILGAVQRIRKYAGGVTQEEFFENGQIQDAVIRQLEVIGEAVKNIPSEALEGEGSVPWRKVASFRDILIHEYFNVDLVEVWGVVTNRLDELDNAVNNLLSRV